MILAQARAPFATLACAAFAVLACTAFATLACPAFAALICAAFAACACAAFAAFVAFLGRSAHVTTARFAWHGHLLAFAIARHPRPANGYSHEAKSSVDLRFAGGKPALAGQRPRWPQATQVGGTGPQERRAELLTPP